MSAAEIVGEGNDLVLSIDYGTTAEGAYPITLVTYEVGCTGGLEEDQNPELVKAFLDFTASDDGQGMLENIGYVPITGELLDKVSTSVDALQ